MAEPINTAKVLDASASPTPGQGASPATDASKSQTTTPSDEKVSSKLQVLMQRERAAIERERVAKAKEQEISAREAKITEFESLKGTNPLKALELLGLSYQDLTKIALLDGNLPPEVQVKRLEQKINAVTEAQKAEAQRKAQEAETATAREHERTVTNFKGEIGSYLKENAPRYELVSFEYPAKAQELIYSEIEAHYETTRKAAVAKLEEEGLDASEAVGEILTIAQAADKVEASLEQKYDKARNLSKVKTLLAPRQAQNVVKPLFNTPSQKPKTLTNSMSATPATPQRRARTDEERIQAAISYARGLRP